MKLIRTEDAVGQVLCHDITQIIPGQFKGARFRKGHIVQPEDIPVLLSIGKENLSVWEKRPGILHEDEAAALLYKAAAGRNIHGTEPKEGKIELVADCDGLLKIDRAALLAAGLDSVNISLDTLHPETFRRITGKDELAAVQNGIRAALASGIPVKLNCVPQPGVNEGELESLAAFAQEHPLQVRFIEMMPIGFGAGLPGLSGPELLERFYRRWPRLQPVTGAAFGDGPAVYYSAPGWRGSIGLIAAVHGKFCASCNRVRLTSQGFLRPCLASESGTDLRALLRSGADDAALLQAIQNTILAKPWEHHFGQGSMPATRGMYRIGG